MKFQLTLQLCFHCTVVYIFFFWGDIPNVVYSLIHSILNINIYKIIKAHFLLSGTFYYVSFKTRFGHSGVQRRLCENSDDLGSTASAAN